MTHRKLCTKRESAFNALFTFATSDPAEECKRCSEAINAVTALCRSQDPSEKKVYQNKQAHAIAGSVDGRHASRNEQAGTGVRSPIECLHYTVHFLPRETSTWLSKSARMSSAPAAT